MSGANLPPVPAKKCLWLELTKVSQAGVTDVSADNCLWWYNGDNGDMYCINIVC
jgi:hypothetical protein